MVNPKPTKGGRPWITHPTPNNDALPPHKDYYRKLRENIQQWIGQQGPTYRYGRYVLALPDLLHLLSRLILDHRISPGARSTLGVATAYILSPLDAIPEGLAGPQGYLDDVVVAVAALNRILNEENQQVVQEHWAGEQDILVLVQEILKLADSMVGSGAWQQIRQMFEGKS